MPSSIPLPELNVLYFKHLWIWRLLVGSVGRAWDSRSQGREFEPHTGGSDYVSKLIKIKILNISEILSMFRICTSISVSCYIICRALLEMFINSFSLPTIVLTALMLLTFITKYFFFYPVFCNTLSCPVFSFNLSLSSCCWHLWSTPQLSCLLRCCVFFLPTSEQWKPLSNLHHLGREGLNSSIEEKSKPSFDTLFFA